MCEVRVTTIYDLKTISSLCSHNNVQGVDLLIFLLEF